MKIASQNPIIVACMQKDALFAQWLNPRDDAHYAAMKDELVQKYGKDEVRAFTKAVRADLVENGFLKG